MSADKDKDTVLLEILKGVHAELAHHKKLIELLQRETKINYDAIDKILNMLSGKGD